MVKLKVITRLMFTISLKKIKENWPDFLVKKIVLEKHPYTSEGKHTR